MATDTFRRTFRAFGLAALASFCVTVCAAAQDATDGPVAAPPAKRASSREQAEQQAATPSRNFLGLEADPFDGPIVTDRPDFTEATAVVPRGRVQLESGYTFTANDDDGVRSADHLFPEYLLRVGVVKDVELRLVWLGMSLTESMFGEVNDAGRRVRSIDHQDGAMDLSIGTKYHITDADGLIPDLSVIAELGVPTGSDNKTAGDVEPGVKLLWAYELTERLSLAGNLNLAVLMSERGRFVQPAASLTLGYALAEGVGMYVEYFGLYPNDRGTDAAHYANGGFTFLITDDVQLDIRSGVGLNHEADDFFTGVGLSFRF